MYQRILNGIIFLSLCISAQARVINIPSDYSTIQSGIDAAVTGDTVLVGPGRYTETLTISNRNILLTSSYGPDSTLIFGRMAIGPNVDTTNTVRGFYFQRIAGGNAILSIDSCSSIIEDNIFIWPGQIYIGALGIYLSNSHSIIRNNILQNMLGYAGATIIHSGGGYPIIERNLIRNNIANMPEAAYMWAVYMGAGIFRYNVVSDNRAEAGEYSEVYGLVVNATSYEISNNTICNNRAGFAGTGAAIAFAVPQERDSIYIKNNIIAFNICQVGIDATILDSAWQGWDYNLVFENGSINYHNFQPGPHDIQTNPSFVDATHGDYHLQPNSPCIDAGDPNSPLDPDGTRADIGAYYFDQPVDINDGTPTGPYQFELHQNYPNPFNAQTIISYELQKQSNVSLRIVAITGQFVIALANKEMQKPGQHQYVWEGQDKNGRTVSTGIYFYELYVNDYRESKAMIMIK